MSYSQARFIAALRLSAGDQEGAWTIAGRALGVPSSWMPALFTLVLRGGVMLLAPFIEW